jgi:Zn-finger nucleic acid-binding protein
MRVLKADSPARGCACGATAHIGWMQQARTAAMKCPIDGTQLVMTERSGVEIDYCPECRGVWLDRGELDKIIERGEAPARAAPEPRGGYEPRQGGYDPRQGDRHQGGHEGQHGRPYKKKREGFLSDLFDF